MTGIASPKHLLASIHDVGPGSEAAVLRLAELLERRLGGPRFAMLVVPDHWGRHPLSQDRLFQARLRSWADSGIEMFVHGWFHKDDSENGGGQHRGAARLKARHMTAGEGEFLGLDEATALSRMLDGKALLEDVIGRPAAGFVAPAWLYGDGARAALRKAGLPIVEDHWRVWSAKSDATLAKGPVITWASRSTARTASSLAFAALARRVLPMMETVRVAVHPGDVTKKSLIASIDTTLKRFAATHTPSKYQDLCDSMAEQ
ncbi:polysaccharide deacetylase family protein [Novosphingobium sp.]|uniref:polysaccharide deacetylase family protein n=1 Tax=Novosphingobium sp. TaxID=1874826 RepID=UPI0028B0961F|nr:polysaccharide deacetylase family protein [Novosphingobium sp.]